MNITVKPGHLNVTALKVNWRHCGLVSRFVLLGKKVYDPRGTGQKYIDKKRTFISRVENDGRTSPPLKTLFYIAERELEEKTKIEVQL